MKDKQFITFENLKTHKIIITTIKKHNIIIKLDVNL